MATTHASMTSVLRRALLRRAAIGSALLLFATALAWGVSSNSGWRVVEGDRTAAGLSTHFVLQYRDSEAVLRESISGRLVHEASCHRDEFREVYPDSDSDVRRTLESEAECFRLVAGNLLGFADTRSGGLYRRVGFASIGELEGEQFVAVGESAPWTEIFLLSGSDLPVKVIGKDGVAIEWEYQRTGDLAEEAPPAQSAGTPTEKYVAIERSALENVMGGASLPAELAGLQWDAGFSYEATLVVSPRYYAIWSDRKGNQIQFVVGRSPQAAPSKPQFEVDAGAWYVLRVGEGDSEVQIMASTSALLREAVRVLRPEYAVPDDL